MPQGRGISDINIAAEETFSDNEIIFNEGSSGDWVYAIIKGKVEIFKVIAGKRIVVDTLIEGDMFGEVSFVDKKPRSASAKAVGEVTLGIYDREFLTHGYNRLPSDFKAIFDYMARRLRKMTNVAANLAGRKDGRSSQSIEVNFKTVEEFNKAYSTNIGGGGIFLQIRKIIPTGTELELKFNLPGDPIPILTGGKVVWLQEIDEPGVGVQFINMQANDEIRLNSFIRSNQDN
jgi:CRP/FNR family cyclic AMP-dependent transcriptional regulator